MLPWQRALLDLRAEFLALSHADLHCVVVRQSVGFAESHPSTGDQFPSSEMWTDEKPIVYEIYMECSPAAGSRFRLKPIIYGNDRASLPAFERLSREAFGCISREPQSSGSQLGSMPLWVDRVADLALEKRPDSPLAADAFRFRTLSDPSDPGPPTDQDLAARAMEPHYIRLPSNVFRSSVWAIDLILHDSEQFTQLITPTGIVSSAPTASPDVRPSQGASPGNVPSATNQHEGKLSGKNIPAKPRRKRDGEKTLKVVGFLQIYMEGYNAGVIQEPLPNGAGIARHLKVSESTVSRVGRRWIRDHRRKLKDEMLINGWKDKHGDMDAYLEGNER